MCGAKVGYYRTRLLRQIWQPRPLSAKFIALHYQDIALFQEGVPALDALKLVAEQGDISGYEVRHGADILASIF